MTVTATPTLPPVAERCRKFQSALSRRLDGSGVDAGWANRLVPFTLTSPLIPLDGDEDGRQTIAATLELEPEACVLAVRRFGAEGGWDQRNPRAEASNGVCQAVVAGSVFVFDLGTGRRVSDVSPLLESLEKNGVGQRIHQGFGRLIAFDPAVAIGMEKKK